MGYRALGTALLKRKKTDDLLTILVQALTKPGAVNAIDPLLKEIAHDRSYAFEVLDHGLKLLSANPPGIDKSCLRILYNICGTRVNTLEAAGENADKELAKLTEIGRLAIKLEPSPLAYRQLVEIQRHQNHVAEAAGTIETLMERYPDERNARWLSSLGELRRQAGQFEPAITAFREAIKLEPNVPALNAELALVLGQTGKFDEAIATLREALKKEAADPYLNSVLGLNLTQAGKNDEAIAHYKGLLERFPANEDLFRIARQGLSVVYINQGDYAKGEAELEILYQRTPDEPGVNNDLGYLYADQGKNLEKAESMIRKALQDKPDEAAYLDSLGWVLFKRGKAQQAVEPLERAVKKGTSTTDATVFEHLGDVYFHLQNYEKAKDAWSQAERAGAKAVPPDKRLPEIRKKLKSLEQVGSTPKVSAGKTP
jgi:tetratricopeptide (TPR) repeat protein